MMILLESVSIVGVERQTTLEACSPQELALGFHSVEDYFAESLQPPLGLQKGLKFSPTSLRVSCHRILDGSPAYIAVPGLLLATPAQRERND